MFLAPQRHWSELPGTQAEVETQTAMGRKNFLFPGRKVTGSKSSWYSGGKVALDALFYTFYTVYTCCTSSSYWGM